MSIKTGSAMAWRRKRLCTKKSMIIWYARMRCFEDWLLNQSSVRPSDLKIHCFRMRNISIAISFCLGFCIALDSFWPIRKVFFECDRVRSLKPIGIWSNSLCSIKSTHFFFYCVQSENAFRWICLGKSIYIWCDTCTISRDKIATNSILIRSTSAHRKCTMKMQRN